MEGFTPYPPELVQEYTTRGIWPNRVLGDVLDEAVQRYSESDALVDENTRVTYREYGERVDRLALGMLDLGLKPGDMLTLQVPNRVEYCILFFACAKIGVIPVLALPQFRSHEMEYILNLTQSAASVEQ